MNKLFSAVALSATLIGLNAQAQTITVGASGADFTSLQAAINSIDATNGQADVIEIIDGGDYDEQLVLGGLPPIDAASGAFITDLVNQNRDALVIRGTGATKPKIGPSEGGGLVNYGVFENDLGDNFAAGIAFFGKDITIENVEIRQPAGGGYGLNGQGVELTFSDVLFKPNTVDQQEDFFNFNNSDGVATLFGGTGNSATFENCEFDGEREDGSLSDSTFLYYHGINEPIGVVDSFKFEGCTIKNFAGDFTRLRARAPENCIINQEVINCVFENIQGGGLSVDGAGQKTVDGSVFRNHHNAAGISPDDVNAAILIRGRSGSTGSLTVTNSIFTDIGTSGASDLENRAAIVIQNDGSNGDIVIDHCTFDGNGTGIRALDNQWRPRTVTVTNSIFSNHAAYGASGDGVLADGAFSYVGSGLEEDLALTFTNCLFFNNAVGNFDIGTETASVTGDPLYADVVTYALSNGSPALGAATDGTNIGAWQEGGTSINEFMLY